ncbi:MAG TPA: hypothetical protein VFI25_19515 [Planctomycetota bacterium]|nr:hypothetical protein [Planctomycetota bacterium]
MRSPFFLGALALGALAGCRALGLSGPEERWQEVTVNGVGVDDLWTVVTTSLNQSGFRRLEIDRAGGSGSSGWDVSLHPYSGGGWRERAHVRVEPAGERKWKVGVRVEREKNETVRKTLEETEAEWDSEPDNLERARIVARRIVAALAFPEAPASGR